MIEFEDIQVNIGGGMKKDKFIAPIGGIYRFSFSANTCLDDYGNVEIEVRHSGKDKLHILHIRERSHYYNNNIAFTWLYYMAEENDMQFFVSQTPIRSAKKNPITFTAELIAECEDLPDRDCQGIWYGGEVFENNEDD